MIELASNNDLGFALKQLKSFMKHNRILEDYRDHLGYIKPSDAARLKQARAAKQRKEAVRKNRRRPQK